MTPHAAFLAPCALPRVARAPVRSAHHVAPRAVLSGRFAWAKPAPAPSASPASMPTAPVASAAVLREALEPGKPQASAPPALMVTLARAAARLRAVRTRPEVRLARMGAGLALAMVGLGVARGTLGTVAVAGAATTGSGRFLPAPLVAVFSRAVSIVPEGMRVFLRPFTEAFGVVFLSEFGDKSMFATALMAMKHSPLMVLVGSLAALTVMTLIACFLGQLMHFLPAMVTHVCTIALFVFFGAQMIWQSRSLPDTPGGSGGERADAEELVGGNATAAGSKLGVLAKISSLIFVAEWCDRSMLATMALAASSNTAAVIGGATAANIICTGLAVGGAALVSSRISERMVALTAGILFEFFAVFTFLEGPEGE